jgi:hypothetical protein
MFAFRDGAIDRRSINNGICHDGRHAYAVILSNGDEINSASPDRFTFCTTQRNPGFYRLIDIHNRGNAGIRVFRTHSLSSFWAPVAGIRYDGR